MAYTGYRHVFPMRSTSGMVHPYKDTTATYSNYSIYSDTHALEDAPLNDVVPGESHEANAPRKSQQFTGKFSYNGMESNLGAESAPELRHAQHEFHGPESARVFGDDFGHDGTREFNYSGFKQIGGLGVTDPMDEPGHTKRAYGAAYGGFGPVNPYLHQGADSVITLGDPGNDEPAPDGFYGASRFHEGAPSTKAL